MYRLSKFKLWFMAFSALALALLCLGIAPAQLASADENTAGADEEGAIALIVTNPPTAGTAYVDVQWQDPAGGWHNIDNWLIPFDQSPLGYTVNWVDPADLGTGPFRWVMFDQPGGKMIGASDSFMFPSDSTWFWTTLTLGAAPERNAPPAPEPASEE